MKVAFLLAAIAVSGALAVVLPSVPRPVVARTAFTGPLGMKITTIEKRDHNPHYVYGYSIEDTVTGDSKSQQESRTGDIVQGSYTVVDPDGIRRIVEYTADSHNGFNAVVYREPQNGVLKAATTLDHRGPAAIRVLH